MPTEQEYQAQGYTKIGKNLWQGPATNPGWFFLRQGEMTPVGGMDAAELRKYSVEVEKIPKDVPLAAPKTEAEKAKEGLERWSRVTDLNKLKGTDYNEARTSIEKIDDALIDRELAGEIVGRFVYSFDQGNRKVVGLTYAGIREMSKRQGRIEMESCDIVSDPEHWIVKCRARSLDSGVAMFGVAEQPKFMTLKNGNKVRDETSLQKAVSKSQRNALRGLISETQAVVLLEKWLKESASQD